MAKGKDNTSIFTVEAFGIPLNMYITEDSWQINYASAINRVKCTSSLAHWQLDIFHTISYSIHTYRIHPVNIIFIIQNYLHMSSL